MSVILLALPVALILGLIAVIAFVLQVRSGQFDDLDTPPLRMLYDDVENSRDVEKSIDETSGERAGVDSSDADLNQED